MIEFASIGTSCCFFVTSIAVRAEAADAVGDVVSSVISDEGPHRLDRRRRPASAFISCSGSATGPQGSNTFLRRKSASVIVSK